MHAICQLWKAKEGQEHFSLHRDEETHRNFAKWRQDKQKDIVPQDTPYWSEIVDETTAKELEIVESIVVFRSNPPPKVTLH